MWKPVRYHSGPGFFWVRFGARGVKVVDRSIHRCPFSVRNGYVKEIRFGKWGISMLRCTEEKKL